MTHALLLVAIPKGADDVDGYITDQMRPYDERGDWFKDGSRWDWWSLGGRWTGYLDGYKPREDPANTEQCDLCFGTGTRTAPVPGDPSWKPTPGQCNGCRGKGQHVKWPTEWADHAADVMTVGKALQFKRERPWCGTFLRDWHWYENERVGWFGCAAHREDGSTKPEVMRLRHEKSEALITNYNEHQEEWEARFVSRFLEQLDPESRLAVVDYHI